MIGRKTSFIVIILSCIIYSAPLSAYTPYPVIETLTRDDPVFRQAIEDIDRYYRAEVTDDEPPPLTLFSYTASEGDTVFSIAARFNLPYETIVLLNGIRSPEKIRRGMELLVPNQPGLFIPNVARNDLERLICSWRTDVDDSGRNIVVTAGGMKRAFSFLEGERFHPIERSFFLNVLFRFPLSAGVISSGYGTRENPFTHEKHFHHGVDIAAPSGSEVYAATSGEVIGRGVDPTLGNYIVLLHRGNFTTIYGHLQETFVFAGHKVQSGAIIGTVGSTGLSTGPHLHFEIRNSGESWDPSEMLSIDAY